MYAYTQKAPQRVKLRGGLVLCFAAILSFIKFSVVDLGYDSLPCF